ncbi:hypothetical protein [Actinomycetospora corticicola]|uniref:Uncharacterized protein n=1 Tax=Actinomycetospora corticicola TaxID=663602 RepID=A0A7Y9DSS6_9PSEU|nr:hypothetical protein [Actinomycetospora corticicola]NYD34774.1 hypothetical protein [Actinomycetospora corticicola]
MSDRPMSERKHVVPTPPSHCWEVRGWQPPPPPSEDDAGWRTVAFCPSHDDAVVIAHALVAGSGPDGGSGLASVPARPFEYVEVWGPSEQAGGRSHTCERYPEPDPQERRAMWLRAASSLYTDGLSV